ncbi:hypothetical protein C772_02172 [Bhargavaea cecembensis DSE10]|uniref:Uncharacterized protein n=1 Tax=Bhargavaea cecembensis DSE10 TaxID=1235279 RepID=M7NFD7_9BACL|nr:hypothetical protein [Bhargavaea cecembensis]EMR05901.1 hypothetical protein C772_02172 [Bhargavaea cecembensis DSE10]
MRRFFRMVPFLEIEDHQTLRLNGKFTIGKIGERAVSLRLAPYAMTLEGEAVKVEEIGDEAALITFDRLDRFTLIRTRDHADG